MLLMLVATSSEASKSCLSRTEARQYFGRVHIYWHGKDHCWDRIPTRRHHQFRNVQRKYQIHQVERKTGRPKWHDSMSEMVPDNETVRAPWADRWVDIESPLAPVVVRRVGIVEVKPPAMQRKPEPVATPRVVVVVFVVFILALTLVTIELLFRGMIYERPDR
jgi:hypothetical protein